MATKEIAIVEIEKIIFPKAKTLENVIKKAIKRVVTKKKGYYLIINTEAKVDKRRIDPKSKYSQSKIICPSIDVEIICREELNNWILVEQVALQIGVDKKIDHGARANGYRRSFEQDDYGLWLNVEESSYS